MIRYLHPHDSPALALAPLVIARILIVVLARVPQLDQGSWQWSNGTVALVSNGASQELKAVNASRLR
jgi:hypothetical protein